MHFKNPKTPVQNRSQQRQITKPAWISYLFMPVREKMVLGTRCHYNYKYEHLHSYSTTKNTHIFTRRRWSIWYFTFSFEESQTWLYPLQPYPRVFSVLSPMVFYCLFCKSSTEDPLASSSLQMFLWMIIFLKTWYSFILRHAHSKAGQICHFWYIQGEERLKLF